MQKLGNLIPAEKWHQKNHLVSYSSILIEFYGLAREPPLSFDVEETRRFWHKKISKTNFQP
jgi:hypothetical protein